MVVNSGVRNINLFTIPPKTLEGKILTLMVAFNADPFVDMTNIFNLIFLARFFHLLILHISNRFLDRILNQLPLINQSLLITILTQIMNSFAYFDSNIVR